jgi:hypothetical protein
LRLGTGANGKPLDAVIRGRNVLVAGDSRSGKSWITGLLCEQFILKGYSVCILDPEGDYGHLDALPGVIVHRLTRETDPLPDLERILRQPVLSGVVDLSAIQAGAKPGVIKTLLERVNALRRSLGFPHRVVLDEAHYILGGPDAAQLFDRELGGYLLVTYRVTDLSADVLSATDAVIVTKVTDPRLASGLLALVADTPSSSRWVETLASLAIGEALLLPGAPEVGNVLARFRIAPRLTTHVRHREKYLDVVLRPGQEFVFTLQGRATHWRARTLGEFLAVLPQVPEEIFRGHLSRGDFHLWIENVFGDRVLGEEIRGIERGNPSNARESLLEAVRKCYLSAAS